MSRVRRKMTRNVDLMLKNYLSSQKKTKRDKADQIASFGKTKWIPKTIEIPSSQSESLLPIVFKANSTNKKLYGNERTYQEVTSQNNAQSKYLKDQMAMIEKVKKSALRSRLSHQ